MIDDKDRGPDRADTARRNDDKELIDAMEDAPAFGGDGGNGPAFGGAGGGNLQRDIGSRDEMSEDVGDGDGITRVRDSDKPEQADLPRYNQW